MSSCVMCFKTSGHTRLSSLRLHPMKGAAVRCRGRASNLVALLDHRGIRNSNFVFQRRNEIAMSQLLRFPSSVKRDPAIEVWMREHSDELGAIAQRWFEAMRESGDDVRELLHD